MNQDLKRQSKCAASTNVDDFEDEQVLTKNKDDIVLCNLLKWRIATKNKDAVQLKLLTHKRRQNLLSKFIV